MSHHTTHSGGPVNKEAANDTCNKCMVTREEDRHRGCPRGVVVYD
jgi:hypothetical protein